MRSKIMILTLLFIIPLIVFAQSDKYIYLVEKACNDTNLIKIKNLSPDKIQIELMKLGYNIREENHNEVNELIAELRNENPTWSENELFKEF
jgi:hypothetical protein